MGLKHLFKKKITPLKDLSALKTDIHSHLIPGIDDGAKTMEESIELIQELYKLGFRKLIITPHIMSDYFRNTPEIITHGLEQLRGELKNQQIDIEIEAAAEYYFDFEFLSKVEQGNLLTFGDNYLLFELSYFSPPELLYDVIFKLQTSGYKPILAHPERYSYWHNNFDAFTKLKDKGVLFQLNINSLTGIYSHRTQKVAEQLVKRGMIDFVGTDTHNNESIKALNKALSNKYLIELLESGDLMNMFL